MQTGEGKTGKFRSNVATVHSSMKVPPPWVSMRCWRRGREREGIFKPLYINSTFLNESPSTPPAGAKRKEKGVGEKIFQRKYSLLNEGPSPRHRVKGKRTKCKHSKLKVRSSMKVVPALNAPDVRHEITLLGGVWEPPAQGKGGINHKAPRKGVCQKGVRGVLHQGQRGNSSMEPPAGTLHLPNRPFGLSHKRQASRSVEVGAEERETGALHCFSSSHRHVVCVCFSLFLCSVMPQQYRVISGFASRFAT